MRPPQVEGLGRGEGFYCQYALYVEHNPPELGCCIGAHAYVILLAVAAYDTVYGCWPAEALVLAYDCCCRMLGYHEPAVEACIGCEERWQIALAGDEEVGAALGDVGHLSKGYGHEV